MIKSMARLIKYDFIVFFREPFFAFPILILPGVFFFVFMSIFESQIGSSEGFGEYIPIYALLISFLVLFFNIGLQYVTEKERGIHKRLTMSSITTYHIVGAYVFRGVILSMIGFFEILIIGSVVFDATITNNLPLFILTFLLVIGVTLLFSLSTHNLFKNSKQVLPFTIIMFQYVLFCSGLMFSVEAIPEYLKFLVYINPFYHMNELLQSVWKAISIEMMSIYYLIFIVFLCLCLIMLKNRRKEA
ncbi:ABC transporter permease [Bacillus salitolerans]|uniref:Transport permease protein n=1 Tax=Bacillus salitolerans TaxID=1437434 RepID=A0ABW4LWY8_9BACI